ncbi:hypothetical protein M406DRAFT_286207 [Cryphonectria parasitica EP155]|uniref:Ubiquitination network signaling protein n=1 Tax=Cryphonectria parasitica (strain ATCC 38755 / EP155) TaxID=660469 RepID=A0A9P4YD22_CRYP1|nr:uncharacterized protein M406DRAFT_286207 [Cryphonectria parasitica EP155]KAF3771294.1 hypothetical protein M406DRAFT_286207 [Cryphonectria parasitica EP155]
MPRASSAKRQQGAANNRDQRHENGLVGPGKRIINKKKSRNEIRLDGPPRHNLHSNSASQPQPHTAAHQSLSSLDSAAPPPPPSPLPTDDIMSADSLRRPSLAAYSETSSSDSFSISAIPSSTTTTTSSSAAAEDAHRRIDVNAAKNTNVHRDTGPIDLAFSVLRSCPLHDTIAILIILMQLSPFALSSIYTLFTLLTFVPPPTTNSGLSVTEIFDGFGAPNLWTLVGLDLFFLIVFAFMPLQDLILEFAQVVVAMTLGGGASSRGGTTHKIFLCVGVILFNHFGQHQALSRYSSNFRTLLGTSWSTPDSDDPLEPAAPSSYGRKVPRGLFRSILAIHILVQGLVRYVRDWYLRREKRDLLSQSQSDPEAAKTPILVVEQAAAEGGLTPAEMDPNRQAASSAASTKKRRKQSHQVRIRQPLWAALASTKIVMVKEYELSQATQESAGSNATDIHNLGNAPFYTQSGQIWICYVGCDEFCFNTSHFPDLPPPEDSEDDVSGKGPSYIDKTKPFYVRVNHAIWQPTRILPVDSGEEDGSAGTRWTGDIYGLTPMSNYECEFVSTRTDEVIFSTSIRTIPAKTKDADVAKVAGAPRSQYRHESPATTLRTSIAGLEAKLSDEKAKLKSSRKENNRKTNAVKKDIDRLTSQVQSAGGSDDRLRQKVAQNTTQQKQAEQAMEELQGLLKELQTIPEEVLAGYREKQGQYNSEKGQFDQARTAFKRFKSSMEHETKSLDDEQTSLGAKRNKIAARLTKVDGEHARITDANARGLDEAERRRQDTTSFEGEVARREKDFAQRLALALARNQEKQQEAGNLSAMLDSVLKTFKQPDYPAYYERQDPAVFNNNAAAAAAAQWPQYAQNPLWSPSPAAALPAATLAGNTTVNPLYAQPPYQQYQGPPGGMPMRHKSRGRSSSMLSDVSGFTQSTNEDDEGGNNSGASKNTSTWNLNGANITGNPTGGMRSPPGFPPFSSGAGVLRKGSGCGSGFASGSGSGGSMHSGSGSSQGSNKDPSSPV